MRAVEKQGAYNDHLFMLCMLSDYPVSKRGMKDHSGKPWKIKKQIVKEVHPLPFVNISSFLDVLLFVDFF